MADTGFIEKCFNEWMKEHPDSSYAEFRLLCKFWMRIHDSHYGMNICKDNNKQELSTAYGKFTKTSKQMFDEGWCKDCSGDISKCLKKGACTDDEKNI